MFGPDRTTSTATITYDQWTWINRTLASVSLELNGIRHNETPRESKARIKKAIVNAQDILSAIHRNAHEEQPAANEECN